jgi:hypothetical protein
MSIQNLAQGALTAAASVPFYDPVNGADKRASITSLVELIQSLLTASGGLITQYSAPSATGFSVTISPLTTGASMLLLLTPAAGYAAGTIVLPALASCVHGQEVQVTCTQAVATLTVSGNGATVNGAPAALTANSFFRLRFDGVLGGWYRLG